MTTSLHAPRRRVLTDAGWSFRFGIRQALLVMAATVLCWLSPAHAGSDKSALLDAAGQYLGIEVLAPPGSETGRAFGASVAVDGDLAVIGAPSEAVSGMNLHGAAYVFTQADGRWRQRARLQPSVGTASLQFGASVAIAGGQILVGAMGGTGHVYAFDGSGASWSLTQELQGPSGSALGSALSVHGSELLVGAQNEDLRGAAYVFEKVAASWVQRARVQASDRASGDQFGRSVALAVDRLAVGAPFRGGFDTGGVYVFERSGGVWSETAILVPSTNVSAYAGMSLALVLNDLVVGAPGHKSAGLTNSGAVFHYRDGGAGFQVQATLARADETLDQFGSGVQFDGQRVVVSAPGQARAWGRSGRLWTSEFAAGSFSALQPMPDNPAISAGGSALAMSAGVLFAGSRFDEVGEVSADGRVGVYRHDAGGWHADGVLDVPLRSETQRYGMRVAMTSAWAAVGAPWRSVSGQLEQGEVLLYQFDGQHWNLSHTVRDPMGQAGDRFGSALAIDGNRLVVGSPNRNNASTSAAGSAVIFEYNGSQWVAAYRYDNAFAPGDRMGTAVAIRGDRATIAAPNSAYGGQSNGGLVAVLLRGASNWSVESLLAGASGEKLGSALSMSDTSIAAGAPGAAANAGRVAIFRKPAGSWSQFTSLAAPAGAAGFGKSLQFDSNLLAITAPDGDAGAGRVRVYREEVASFVLESLPATPAGARALGSSLAIAGSRLLAGSLNNGTAAAQVHIYDRSAAGVWSYVGALSSPDGSATFPDGWGETLAIARPHAFAGAQWRAQDEGRVFALTETIATGLTLNSVSPAQPVTGQQATLNYSLSAASGTPTGTVRWHLNEASHCEDVPASASGSCIVQADHAGALPLRGEFLPDAWPHLPARLESAQVTVNKAATALTLQTSVATIHPDQVFHLDAGLSVTTPGAGTPTGQLTFHSEALPGVTLCPTSVDTPSCGLQAGDVATEHMTVRYLGDNDFATSESAVLTFEVTPWPANAQLAANAPAQPKVGQALTAEVTVTADAAAGTPTGRVRLLVDGVPGGWVALGANSKASPSATAATAGTHTLSAEYDGSDNRFGDALSSSRTFTAVALGSSVTLTSTPASATAGDAVILHAVAALEDASAATGELRFYRDAVVGDPLCVVAAPSGDCSFTPSASGNVVLYAVYGGDSRAASSSAALSLPVQRRASNTQIISIMPAQPIAGESYQVNVFVGSDFGAVEGTVIVDNGEAQCVADLVGGSGSCMLSAITRGPDQLNAGYTPSGDVHAASNAAPFDFEIAGVPTTITLLVGVGPYLPGDNVDVAIDVRGTGGNNPSSGQITLRRDDASGAILCSGDIASMTSCLVSLSHAGTQVLYASYDGTVTYAPSEGNNSVPVSVIDSRLVWLGITPAIIAEGDAFMLVAAVESDRGVPPGTVDFSESGSTLCAGVAADVDGRYRCAVAAAGVSGTHYVDASFTSSSTDYHDIGSTQFSYVVAQAIRQARVLLDDGVNSFVVGDPLEYELSVRNVAVSGTVVADLLMNVPPGTTGTSWDCVEALGGTVCPAGTGAFSEIHLGLSLPAGSLLRFLVTVTVNDPPPVAVVAQARLQLGPGESNDDAAGLVATDVDTGASGRLFTDGFENLPPVIAVKSGEAAWQSLPIPVELPVLGEGRPVLLQSVADDDGTLLRVEAARILGEDRYRHLWFDRALKTWIAGPWVALD